MPSLCSSPPAPVQFRTEQLELSNGTPVGSGAISHVVQCRLHTAAASSLPVIVKIVSKLQVLQQGKVQSIMNEKAALQRLGPHPYIARLFGTSQSEDELYYVLEWLPHGDLLQHIRRAHLERVRAYNATARSAASPVTSIPSSSTALRCLDFHDIRLITAQLVLALARAAEKGVVLRDLKPENVAFDEKHRACLLDFDTVDLNGAAVTPETNKGVACSPPCGAAAEAMSEDDSDDSGDGGSPHQQRAHAASTGASAGAPSASAAPPRRLTVSEIRGMRDKSASFCGTAQYVSPEMVGECKWSFSSDLWALGALVYEMAYGEHLFAGVSQFAVLAKVIQGDYVERANLFPFIDFDESAASTENDTVAAQSPFAALKDFIVALLNIDPSKRLGVHRETHRFDEAALRGHALFRGFAWELVDAQLDTFHARSFEGSGSKRAAPVQLGASRSPFDQASERRRDSDSDNDDDDAVLDEAATAAAAAAAKVALEDLLAASVDPSPSLESHYHVQPFNDPSYAEYVYRATADANPFEKFFVDAANDASAGAATAAAPPSSSKACSPASPAVPSAAVAAEHEAAALRGAVPADTYEASSEKGREEEDDVIDDVGIRYAGSHAHSDFQE